METDTIKHLADAAAALKFAENTTRDGIVDDECREMASKIGRLIAGLAVVEARTDG